MGSGHRCGLTSAGWSGMIPPVSLLAVPLRRQPGMCSTSAAAGLNHLQLVVQQHPGPLQQGCSQAQILMGNPFPPVGHAHSPRQTIRPTKTHFSVTSIFRGSLINSNHSASPCQLMLITFKIKYHELFFILIKTLMEKLYW